MSLKFGRIQPWTAELAALGQFKNLLLENYSKYFDDLLSGERSLPFGLLVINDLPESIRSSVRLFADDCVLYRNIESPMDCQILQDDMNSLAQWETDWQMKFNVHLPNVTQ